MIIEKIGDSHTKMVDSLEKLNRLLKKYGFKPGKIIETSEIYKKKGIGVELVENPENTQDLEFRYYKFKIEIPTMSFGIEGTEFIASMEIGSEEAGNRIFLGFNPEDEKASEYNDLLFDMARSRKSTCDHCNTVRTRNKLFIFKKDGKLLTIGSTCSREWYGIEIEKFLKAWRQVSTFSEEDEDGFSDSRYRRMRYVSDELTYSIASILRRGFVASKYDNCTANDVMEVLSFLNPIMGYRSDRETPETLTYYRANANKVNQLVLDMFEWYKNLVPSDLFLQNLRSGVLDFSLTTNQAPWAVVKFLESANIEYRVEDGKNRSQEVKPEILVSPDKHVASVGTKIKDQEGQISFTHAMDGDFGVTYLIKIATIEGDLVWFTGKSDYENCSISDLLVGTKVKISGTVKENSQYKDKAQTIITRCKLSKVE